MGLIGHNGGPTMEPGASWRKHCWTTARESLLPTLPIEVLRNRVKRAAELGLDYRTYASVRAQTGHDVVAFLFSSNALRALAHRPQMPVAHREKLEAVQADLRGLAVAPLTAGMMAQANPVLSACGPAPFALGSWRAARDGIRAALQGRPGDRVLLIGDHGLEAEWCAAGRLAGYLPAERYFGTAG